ncbi:MAG TPA: hypothetical protein VHZ30_07855, partial [Verrucomicrobiae bacterium]|nr:hypothetical protein [Verrucomicrobiae bacterium]
TEKKLKNCDTGYNAGYNGNPARKHVSKLSCGTKPKFLCGLNQSAFGCSLQMNTKNPKYKTTNNEQNATTSTYQGILGNSRNDSIQITTESPLASPICH